MYMYLPNVSLCLPTAANERFTVLGPAHTDSIAAPPAPPIKQYGTGRNTVAITPSTVTVQAMPSFLYNGFATTIMPPAEVRRSIWTVANVLAAWYLNASATY
ncbi:hypothetical protein N7474_007829 [Penicillium riverlandense]|uniref:uncharacterized protein n=1 Tax=Penicillium riverlandense TaxID=1903569 RepID=UPI002547433A|nr:uncharacterized protein N7474_007829 [Penicillium riverlandense]KAJ5811528.1 hypothetical protein N7474_007829 [Penicillium riverlandense]